MLVPLMILVRLLRLKLITFENIKVDFFKDQDVAFQYYDFEDQVHFLKIKIAVTFYRDLDDTFFILGTFIKITTLF